jgi:hypothetical protein
LADPGATYLIYLPDGGVVTVDLAGMQQAKIEWFSPTEGRRVVEGTCGGERSLFVAPFGGDAVLYLSR